MIGIIHISPFFDEVIETLTAGKHPQFYAIYEKEEFKIDDAKEVIAKAYLAYEREMLIILAANKYNNAAQNALLKIIEEPPANVQFIIIAKHKNTLLPTIRSRMRIISHNVSAQIPPFELDVKHLSLESIYTFCKANDKAQHTKEEVKLRIESLLFALYDAKIKLNKRELECFDKAIALNQNDATEKENHIFLPLLLRIYHKQKAR